MPWATSLGKVEKERKSFMNNITARTKLARRLLVIIGIVVARVSKVHFLWPISLAFLARTFSTGQNRYGGLISEARILKTGQIMY